MTLSAVCPRCSLAVDLDYDGTLRPHWREAGVWCRDNPPPIPGDYDPAFYEAMRAFPKPAEPVDPILAERKRWENLLIVFGLWMLAIAIACAVGSYRTGVEAGIEQAKESR